MLAAPACSPAMAPAARSMRRRPAMAVRRAQTDAERRSRRREMPM